MIRQLFKMLWRRKKGNALLIFQLFISFLAMSLFIAVNIDKFSNYFQPFYYSYTDAWGIILGLDGVPKDKAAFYIEQLKQRLKSIPGTEEVSNTSFIPFGFFGDSENVTVNNNKLSFRCFMVDENYYKALQLPLLKGKWFIDRDNVLSITPVVVTRDFSNEYFKDQDPLGKTIMLGDKKARIIGVSEVYRDRYTDQIGMTGKGCIFKPIVADTVVGSFIVRTKRASDFLRTEELVRKELSSIKDEKFIVRTSSPVTMIKKQNDKMDLVQLTLALLVFGFLVLNIFLGISGVFSYNISKRVSEIGLRVSAGASSSSILKQFLAETIILTSFAIVPGTFVAIQFLVTGFFGNLSLREGLSGITGAALFIYLLMIACSLYPSLRASKIQPADALHED